jgi:hypothetical protein
VRLDHLLSKEQPASSAAVRAAWCSCFPSGALAIHLACRLLAVASTPPAGGWNGPLLVAAGWARCWVSEGAGACRAPRHGQALASRGRGRAGAWFRPYLENCTVDASIFFLEVCLVVYLLSY